MDIRLMTNIKYQAVFHCIKYGLDSDRQLNNTQIAGQMAAGLGYAGDQKFPNLRTESGTFFVREAKQILVTVNVL